MVETQETMESAGDGGDASALFRRFDDEFRNAYRERTLFGDDPTLDAFVAAWIVREIERLQRFPRAQETARRGVGSVLVPWGRADAALVAVGHSINHAQYYFSAVEAFVNGTEFVLYPWVTIEMAGLALEGCHSACLGFWLWSATVPTGGPVAPAVEAFVRMSVAATVVTLGWSPRR
ncbi:MAG: hypothetical protein KIT14_11835 [bacterium]|nr:hypothetical protein [bacterium]